MKFNAVKYPWNMCERPSTASIQRDQKTGDPERGADDSDDRV